MDHREKSYAEWMVETVALYAKHGIALEPVTLPRSWFPPRWDGTTFCLLPRVLFGGETP